jgi:hypothetical protein
VSMNGFIGNTNAHNTQDAQVIKSPVMKTAFLQHLALVAQSKKMLGGRDYIKGESTCLYHDASFASCSSSRHQVQLP